MRQISVRGRLGRGRRSHRGRGGGRACRRGRAPPVLAGALAVEFGVKRLLLLGAQGGVEGFHGFIALVGLGGVPARSSRMRSMRSGW